jgi:peptidoglycan/LPS O-acetylase OafA/YrhL
VFTAWLLTLTTILAVIFGTHSVHRPDFDETIFLSALYQSISRVAWSIAIAWMIFACQHNYGGLVNWLLSLSLWQPLTKLSYCVFVLHLPIQIMLSASEKQAIYLSDTRMAHKFWGDFGFALMLSLLWTLAFEMPIPILENYLLHSSSGKGRMNVNVTGKPSVNDANANSIDNCVEVVTHKNE